MCGIAGTVALDGRESLDPEVVRRMVATLHHRGPDHRGFFDSPQAILGMARLSIIDLSTGNQPVPNEDESVWVVQNGEVYNFETLRIDLEQRGHHFRSTSDTECIVHAYEEWGDDCVDHLRGMYAFAIWDTRRTRLLLARDRVGEKPLYWATHGGRLAFGSELKALEAAGAATGAVDLVALDEFLAFGYVGAPRTIRQGVRKLAAGNVLTLEHGDVRERTYWRPHASPVHFTRPEEANEAFESVLRDAVRSQMKSDVPLGAFLSGGLDSSTIVALMRSVSSAPIRTFCVGFPESEFDERPYARQIAQVLGTLHEEFEVRPNIVEVLPSLVRDFDEPFGDKSLVPTYYVAKMAKQRVKVVLSGDGGDEVFGGYVSYLGSLHRAARHRRRPRLLNRLIRAGAIAFPQDVPGSFRVRKRSYDQVHRFLASGLVFDPDRKRALYSRELAHATRDVDWVAERGRGLLASSDLDLLTALQHQDMLHYLPDDILVKVDRMTMLNSLESRAPLLDHRLLELSLATPGDWKIANGVTKKPLRAVAAKLLPPVALARRKQGFAMPVTPWLAGGLGDLAVDVLTSQPMAQTGWFRRKVLAREIAAARKGDRGAGARVWHLLCLGLWLTR